MRTVFVKPGPGKTVFLPGTKRLIPAEGMEVQQNVHIKRYIKWGDLIEIKPPKIKKGGK